MSNTSPSPISATLLPSVLRTVVPLVYAMLVNWGVVAWFDLDDTTIWNELITLVVTGLAYVAIRVVERHKAQVGWLLGYAQQPVYVKGEVLSVTEVPTPPTVTTEVETNPEGS